MRSTTFLRRLAAGAVVLAVSGAGLLIGGVANAQAPAPSGGITLSPASGTDLTAPAGTTAGGCNVAGADAYNAFVTGPGVFTPNTTRPDGIAVAFGTAGFSTTGPITFPFRLNFRDLAAEAGQTGLLTGAYTVNFQCVDSFLGTVFQTYQTTLNFTSATAYTSGPQVVATSTALAATPTAPITAGTQSTLTATVTPSNAAGTVQFYNGTTSLGAPVAVAGGTASTTATLPQGTNSLTAVFTGGTGYGNSTSPAVSYQVNAPQGAATSTALSVNPSGTVNQGSPVTMTANVTTGTGTPTGTVTFSDRGTALGAAVTLSGGTATFVTSALTAGTHSLTASYTSSAPTQFANSASAAVTLVVVQPGQSTTSENISTEILAGALVISVNNAQVTLPTPVLRPDATRLETTGAINAVRVADTRSGNPGYTVSGQVGDFSAGPGKSINGANLGWTPNIVASMPTQTVTAGPTVTPAPAIQPGTAPTDPAQGLATSRTLATAASGGSTGTADFGAGLALNVPTSTTAGVYTATLTLTAI